MKIRLSVCFFLALFAISASALRRQRGRARAQRLQEAVLHQQRMDGFIGYLRDVDDSRVLDKHSSLNEVNSPEPGQQGAQSHQQLGLTAGHRPRPFTGDLDILDYFKDVPYEHWSCCMLGKLAGDKGFSCISEHYATTLQIMRMRNRAGSRRRPNVRGYGHTLMNHFQRCFVQGHETQEQFRTCCIAGAIQKDDLLRWEEHRHQQQVEDDQLMLLE